MPSPAPTLVADDNDAGEPTAEAADSAADLLAASTAAGAASTVSVPSSGRYRGEYDSAIVYGFQLAVASGPLCEEPMAGVAFFVDAVHTQAEQDSVEASTCHHRIDGWRVSNRADRLTSRALWSVGRARQERRADLRPDDLRDQGCMSPGVPRRCRASDAG